MIGVSAGVDVFDGSIGGVAGVFDEVVELLVFEVDGDAATEQLVDQTFGSQLVLFADEGAAHRAVVEDWLKRNEHFVKIGREVSKELQTLSFI